MKISGYVLFSFAMLVLAGCKNKTDLDSDGMPGKLVIAVYAGGDNPGGLKAGLAPYQKYLEKKLGMEVQYDYATDYTAVIEAIRSHKAHVAYLSPFSYVLASQSHDITPLVTLGENGKPSMYHSVIFSNYKTGINNINDLKARAKNLTLCFADPASTSGHLIPRAYLTTIGLNPDDAFKQTIFAGSHPASVLSVATGKIDIGCSTTEYGVEKLERSGVLKKGLIKILWTSDPIVSAPVVIRNDVNKELAFKLKNIYLNLRTEAPEILNDYVILTHPNPSKYKYIEVNDSLYNGLRKIAKGIKNLNIAN